MSSSESQSYRTAGIPGLLRRDPLKPANGTTTTINRNRHGRDRNQRNADSRRRFTKRLLRQHGFDPTHGLLDVEEGPGSLGSRKDGEFANPRVVGSNLSGGSKLPRVVGPDEEEVSDCFGGYYQIPAEIVRDTRNCVSTSSKLTYIMIMI